MQNPIVYFIIPDLTPKLEMPSALKSLGPRAVSIGIVHTGRLMYNQTINQSMKSHERGS